MEEAMLGGLVKGVWKEYRVDSSYKADGQKITLSYIVIITQQPITLKQIKNKHDNYKKDQKVQRELYSLSSQAQNETKGVPIASKEVIETYFKANSKAEKFYNIPPTFLNLLEELFNKILAIGDYVKLINKAIKNCIDPALLLVVASQADLADKEAKEEGEEEDKEEVDKVSELELARSSIKSS